jgi:hypothetical protein
MARDRGVVIVKSLSRHWGVDSRIDGGKSIGVEFGHD